jgi:hypothetical protein
MFVTRRPCIWHAKCHLGDPWMLVWATAVPGSAGHPGQGRCLAICATAAFVDGPGSRLAGGGTSLGGAAAVAASGSRSWCRRRGGRARRWRPPPEWWPSRCRAAPRTAAAAPRSAGPGPAKSPPRQAVELMFEAESGMLPTATGLFREARTADSGGRTLNCPGHWLAQEGSRRAGLLEPCCCGCHMARPSPSSANAG